MEDYENDEEEKEIIYWKVGSIQPPQYFKFQSPQEIERVLDQKPNKL